MASKLYVGGLSYSTTSASLRNYFAQCGGVTSATVITDRVTGQSRGFGFVEMSGDSEARAAIAKLDGQQFEGRRLRVSMANQQGPGHDRSRQGGLGSGSRSGSGFGAGFGSGRRQVRW